MILKQGVFLNYVTVTHTHTCAYNDNNLIFIICICNKSHNNSDNNISFQEVCPCIECMIITLFDYCFKGKHPSVFKANYTSNCEGKIGNIVRDNGLNMFKLTCNNEIE